MKVKLKTPREWSGSTDSPQEEGESDEKYQRMPRMGNISEFSSLLFDLFKHLLLMKAHTKFVNTMRSNKIKAFYQQDIQKRSNISINIYQPSLIGQNKTCLATVITNIILSNH